MEVGIGVTGSGMVGVVEEVGVGFEDALGEERVVGSNGAS